MADAVKVLIDDHIKVKRMFMEFERSSDFQLAKQICDELTMHTTLEEEVVYPVLRDEVDEEMAEHAEEEHDEAKALIEEIQAMEPGDPMLASTMRRLQSAVEEHVQEEETEVFPKMEAVVGDKLTDLGTELFRRRTELMAESAAD